MLTASLKFQILIPWALLVTRNLELNLFNQTAIIKWLSISKCRILKIIPQSYWTRIIWRSKQNSLTISSFSIPYSENDEYIFICDYIDKIIFLLPYFPVIGASSNESIFVVKSAKRMWAEYHRMNENQRVLRKPDLNFENWFLANKQNNKSLVHSQPKNWLLQEHNFIFVWNLRYVSYVPDGKTTLMGFLQNI